jgi:endonuclease VIII
VPEGHTLHRYAREHRRALAGAAVSAWSPQGRFADGAARLDGRTLLDVEAYGKHLFYRWDGAPTLHVHLGLYGQFRAFVGDEAGGPTPGTRLALRAEETTIYLAGPTACELIDPDDEERLRARLGPDPLHAGADAEAVWAALQRRRTPIGTALLDQRIVAGVGNVYRAEVLFLCGIAPERPSRSLSREEFDCLWDTLVRLLRLGLRMGRIVTVDPEEAGRPRSRIATVDGRYVYRRTDEPCRRCGTAVRSWELGARTMYACPACQPA